MLEEMRALIALEETGSMVRAAAKLCLTASATTRMIQRLEAHLGVVLLDRSVKPPRFTPLGRTVLGQCRDMLARMEEMRASASAGSEPRGVLRLGLAHALADDTIVVPAQRLHQKFPALRLRLWSELTSTLFERLRAGEIDAAMVLMPKGHVPPAPLVSREITRDTMVITASRNLRLGRVTSLSDLREQPWVLNPTGCLLRAALLEHLNRAGVVPEIEAEVHSIHLQASLVASGRGLGLLPRRHVRAGSRRRSLVALRPGGFELPMSISSVQSGHLGRQDAAVRFLEEALGESFS
jgi:DNA-binding transcriptional LysR family regulator